MINKGIFPEEKTRDIVRLVKGGKNFLIATHRNPDGDAIGSALAVWHLLRGMGKRGTVWVPEGVPGCYMFLSGATSIVRELPGAGSFDATIVVDTADPAILGAPLPPREITGPVIVIDHHAARVEWGDIYLYRASSAVGEIIFSMADMFPFGKTEAFAECVYTAIMTDTGSFHYDATTAEVMHIAAQCIELGVSAWKVARSVYENSPKSRVLLLVDVLSTLEIDLNGRFATLVSSTEMLKRHGLGPDALENFVNYARAIEGVEVAALIRMREDRSIRVSFRSRGNIDVSHLARHFGGGGHHNAAGCTLTGLAGTEEAREKVRQVIESSYHLSTFEPSGGRDSDR